MRAPGEFPASNCREFGAARDARGRPRYRTGRQSYNGAANCPSCQRRRRSADLARGGLGGRTFTRLRRPLFPARVATEPRQSWATLATSASTARDWNSPRMFRRRNAAARPRYFQSRDNDLRRETRAGFSEYDAILSCVFLIRELRGKLAQEIYVWDALRETGKYFYYPWFEWKEIPQKRTDKIKF